MFRFRLGRKTVGDNLVTNGTFDANLAGWGCGTPPFACPAANWAWNAGVAQYTGICTNGEVLSQDVFSVGKRYRVQYDILSTGAFAFMGLFVGDYGKEYDRANNIIWTTITKDRICLSNIKLQFSPALGINLDNVSAYLLDWNDAIINEPLGWVDSKSIIIRDQQLDGLYFSYITDLEFWGDGYQFIKNEFDTNGMCGKVPILIEYRCGENAEWEEYFEGLIYISDSKFDESKCQVECTIEELTPAALLIKGGDTDVYFISGVPVCGGGADLLPLAQDIVKFHDNTGTHIYVDIDCWNIEKLFKRIVLSVTELEVDFESNLFFVGLFRYLVISFGILMRNAIGGIDPSLTRMSFNELFKQMDAIFNISWETTNVGGVPRIRIEEKSFFHDDTVILTLNDVPGLRWDFDKSRMVRNIKIGYKETSISESEGTLKYEIIGDCLENELDKGCDFIQDSALIFPVLAGNTDYDDKIFIIECEKPGVDIESLVGGGNLYNENIDFDDNMGRWIYSMMGDAILQSAGVPVISKGATPNLQRVWEFEYPLTQADWKLLRANTKKQIRFNSEADNIDDTDGFIDNIEYDNVKGIAIFKLLTE